MEIRFKTNKLAKDCNDLARAKKKYGSRAGEDLIDVLNDLEASDTLAVARTLSHLKCHELKGDRVGQIACTITKGLRLIFVPDNDPVPTKDDGGLDWTLVDAIEVIDIDDYH